MGIYKKEGFKMSKKKHFRYKYIIDNSIIECNLQENKFNMYLLKFKALYPLNGVAFSKYLANKTHYFKVKCNNIDYSLKQINYKKEGIRSCIY